MAAATTPPAAAPAPMSTRAIDSVPRVGARAANTLAATCRAVTASSGMRRPTLSLSGPTMSWPSAKPIMVPVRVSWIAAAEVWKSASSTGKAGRYRSIVNGPRAVNAPSRTM